MLVARCKLYNPLMANIDELRDIRIKKLNILKDAGMDPYPASVVRDLSLLDLRSQFETYVEKGEALSVVGRIMAIRGQGAILFVVLDDGTDRFQTVFKKDTIEEELFTLFTDAIDIGDFIEVQGVAFATDRGEKSILAK